MSIMESPSPPAAVTAELISPMAIMLTITTIAPPMRPISDRTNPAV